MTTFLSILFALALYFCYLCLAHAQSVPDQAPSPVADPAYVKHGSKFYILGGHQSNDPFNITEYIRQFYVIDLAQSWAAISPAWSALSNPETNNTHFAAAISADGTTLIAFPSAIATGGDNTTTPKAYKFSINHHTWSVSNAAVKRAMSGLSPVTVNETDNVYVLGGYIGPGEDLLDIYSFQSDSFTSSALPPTNSQSLPSRTFYKAAWSHYRKSILYIGSTGKVQDQSRLLAEFIPGTSTWSFPVTTGPIAPVIWHCAAMSDNGELLYVYGGIDARNPTAKIPQGLFILDIVTMTWRAAATGENRVYSACTVAGDYFLAWGGANVSSGNGLTIADINKKTSPVLIYKTSEDKWVDRYTPPTYYLSPNMTIPIPSLVPPPQASSPDQANEAAVAGSIVAVIVVVLIAGFIIWKIKRRAASVGKRQHSTGLSSRYPAGGVRSRGGGVNPNSDSMAGWSRTMYSRNEYPMDRVSGSVTASRQTVSYSEGGNPNSTNQHSEDPPHYSTIATTTTTTTAI